MLSFKNFMNEEDDPAPIDPTTRQPVDAELWANPRYRQLWKSQNAQQGTAPNLSQTTAPSPAMQQKAMPRTGIGRPIGSLARQIPGRYDSNVANSVSIAMSPAGRATYKYYWSEKEQKVKPNPYHQDNAIR